MVSFHLILKLNNFNLQEGYDCLNYQMIMNIFNVVCKICSGKKKHGDILVFDVNLKSW